MLLSPSTLDVLEALEVVSSHRLSCRDDLGLLVEAAHTAGATERLGQLSFQATIVINAFRIMQRIGPTGTGYENLAREFSSALAAGAALAGEVVASLPPEDRDPFRERFLGRTQESIQRFLTLCGDLGWYKTWSLDRTRAASHGQ